MKAQRQRPDGHWSALPAAPRLVGYERAYALGRHLGLTGRDAAQMCVEIMIEQILTKDVTPQAVRALEIAAALLCRLRAADRSDAGDALPEQASRLRRIRELRALWRCYEFSDFENAHLVGLSPGEVRRLRRRLAGRHGRRVANEHSKY